MFGLEPYHVLLATVGGSIILAFWLPRFLSGREPATSALLILLGLGWSASTVAGSALLNDAAPMADRVRLQGRGDLAMNLAGALGGALSGPVLALVGYTGLAWGLLLPIVVVVTASVLGLARQRDR